MMVSGGLGLGLVTCVFVPEIDLSEKNLGMQHFEE
jgi:hypothetical protein